jgi:hypothetical protein
MLRAQPQWQKINGWLPEIQLNFKALVYKGSLLHHTKTEYLFIFGQLRKY